MLSVHSTRPQFGAEHKKPITLLVSDFDHTIAIWTNYQQGEYDEKHFQSTLEAFQEHVDQGNPLMVASSRSPSLLAELRSMYKQFPFMKYSACLNGQMFFENDNSQPTDEFVSHLSPSNQSAEYEAKVAAESQVHGASKEKWSIALFHRILQNVLKNLGFESFDPQTDFAKFKDGYGPLAAYYRQKNNPSLTVTGVGDQTSLFVGPINTETGQRMAVAKGDQYDALRTQVTQAVTEQLDAYNIGYQLPKHDFEHVLCQDFVPNGANKQLATQHAIASLEKEGYEVKAVITIDDNENGLTMLQPDHYLGKSGKNIPNYPIVMGQKLKGLQHPRLVRAARPGALGNAVREQHKQIDKIHFAGHTTSSMTSLSHKSGVTLFLFSKQPASKTVFN